MWITVLFSYTVISIHPLSSLLFFVSGIKNGNETNSPSDILGASLAIRGTIIPRFNGSTRSTLTKALLLFIIEALIVCRNGHKKMVFYAVPSTRAREALNGCSFVIFDS